ncbi:hypothetical protein I656_00037 [Geobacillus sp. WSUCF1]|nr:hypothetical protein I656_00037 [Geobacillus sp. WSUCF1]
MIKYIIHYTTKEANVMNQFAAKIHAPDYPPRDRHPAIFRLFDNLKPGEVMELVNDHDPRPLQYQFMMERPDQFTWEYLEEGPDVWRVAIGKK